MGTTSLASSAETAMLKQINNFMKCIVHGPKNQNYKKGSHPPDIMPEVTMKANNNNIGRNGSYLTWLATS